MPQQSRSRDQEKIVVRLPDGMRSKLTDRAKANFRSTNSEVVMILANALGDESNAAAGPGPEKAVPAAAANRSALPGGSIDPRQ